MDETIIFTVMPSPVGPLTLRWSDGGLSGVFFENARELAHVDHWIRDDARLAPVRRQLEEYFAGTRRSFDLPLVFGGTPFQRAVWRALVDVPFATTTTYGALAMRIGRAKAVRAVGAANGQNPLVIVVPCHRVVGADGSLTGFGGGLPRKTFLLGHERAAAAVIELRDVLGPEREGRSAVQMELFGAR